MIRFNQQRRQHDKDTKEVKPILFAELLAEEFKNFSTTVEPMTSEEEERLAAQMQEANDTEPIGAPGQDTDFARENQRQDEPNRL